MQFIGVLGIIVTLLLAWLVSSNKKKFKFLNIGLMILIQFVLTFILLNTSVGEFIIKKIAGFFEKLLGFAAEGVNFVFGGIANEGANVFFLNVLMPIVVVSLLIGILQYLRILPLIIKLLGIILSKITGMGNLESYNGAASVILGQSEVFISLKNKLPHISDQRLYTLSAQAMSSVSMSIVGAYMTMLDPKYVVTAIVLNLFGGFIIAGIVNPYEVDEDEDGDDIDFNETKGQSFFEVVGEYILDGFKVAITVAAMLIGYIALIAIVNNLFLLIPGVSITFQDVLGYIFAPLAFIIGVPWDEAVRAGSLMATKLVTNEFVAMINLGEVSGELSERTKGIVSVFLVSFANFSSIGIIAGSVKGLNAEKGNSVARFGLKLVYGASLVSLLSAAIVGFFI